MLRILIVVTLASAALGRSQIARLTYSAATPAQIRFAVENKYDDTGPGAKDPQRNLAYQTLNNLEDALVGYLNDPDTKLPAHERAKAIKQLNVNNMNNFGSSLLEPLNREIPRRPFYQRYKGYGYQTNDLVNQVDISPIRSSAQYPVPALPRFKSAAIRFQKLQQVRFNPLSLSHYTQEPVLEQYDSQLQNSLYVLDNSADSAGLREAFVSGVVSSHPAPAADSAGLHEAFVPGVVSSLPAPADPANPLADPKRQRDIYRHRGHFSFWDANGKRTQQYIDDRPKPLIFDQ